MHRSVDVRGAGRPLGKGLNNKAIVRRSYGKTGSFNMMTGSYA